MASVPSAKADSRASRNEGRRVVVISATGTPNFLPPFAVAAAPLDFEEYHASKVIVHSGQVHSFLDKLRIRIPSSKSKKYFGEVSDAF